MAVGEDILSLWLFWHKFPPQMGVAPFLPLGQLLFHQYKPVLEAGGHTCMLWQALHVAGGWGPWASTASPTLCTRSSY